jgi:hypothetical protein
MTRVFFDANGNMTGMFGTAVAAGSMAGATQIFELDDNLHRDAIRKFAEQWRSGTIKLNRDGKVEVNRQVVELVKPPEPKSVDELSAEIEKLDEADYRKLQTALMAELVRANPRFPKQIGIDINGMKG